MLKAWVTVLNSYFFDDIQSDCFTVCPGQQTDNTDLKTAGNGSAKQVSNKHVFFLKHLRKTTLSELKGQLTVSVTQLNVNQSYLLNQTTIKCKLFKY